MPLTIFPFFGQRSGMFEKIKKYYEAGVWSEQRVREAVAKNIITPEQFKEITGKGLLGD